MDLTFTSDGILRSAEALIARVALTPGRPFASVTIGAESYEIVRQVRTGWRFELEQVTSAQRRVVCRFSPHRLRRGGRLASTEAVVRLTPKLCGRWSISVPGQAEIGARIRRHRLRSDRFMTTLSTAWEAELILEAEGSWRPREDMAATIAFACWLIVQWSYSPNLG